MALPVDRSSRDRATLVNLQKQDDATSEILASASHVSMYRFDSAGGQWNRHNVEGPLFVYKRSQAPRFRMAIMNRLSTTNATFDITAEFTLQLIEPYMIFRHQPSPSTDPVIYGCWFPNGEERGHVYALLERLIASQANVARSDTGSVIDRTSAVGSGAHVTTAPGVGDGSSAAVARVSPPLSPSGGAGVDASTRGTQSTTPRVKASDLLTPAMLLGEGNVATLKGIKAGASSQQPAGTIDVDTLRQALMELIGDDDFVLRLHGRLRQA